MIGPRVVWSMGAWYLSRCLVQAWARPRPSHWSRCYSINPTTEWKGSSHSSSEFAHHVLIEQPTPLLDSIDRVLQERRHLGGRVTELSAEGLLQLGSVWFLPSSAPRDPALGGKPQRLSSADASLVLEEGDYLRIHHDPRRFPVCHAYNWRLGIDQVDEDGRPGVVVAANDTKGWMVIEKPASVPVHMTVDNAQENVAAAMQQALSKEQDGVYLTTPQRLDQNTSGLLVLATSKPFASYFASLLSSKTRQQLEGSSESIGAIHKLYRCLVCLIPPPDNSSWSVNQAAAELQAMFEQDRILRHYLEPSIRAPKRFVTDPPPDSSWPEALLKFRRASDVYALIGNQPGQRLAEALWPNQRMPHKCQAVVELEIQLLTGRTHQIRGQLSAAGYALVGDAQYGGSLAHETYPPESEQDLDRLALQCCELEFLDPDVVEKEDGTIHMVRSGRWNRFRLDQAWWTDLLKQYTTESALLSEADTTTLAADSGLTEPRQSPAKQGVAKSHLLPDRVSLSPGKNKYVLVRATHPNDDNTHWFVKSAAPAECGGPYHGNVAQDLREWIEAAGYQPVVTGGGRIDYRPDEGRAIVYGFSYGFGRGDHAKAAAVIEEHTHVKAIVDDSPDLY